MPASYRYRGQNITAKLKNRVNFKLASPGNYRKGSSKLKKSIRDFAPLTITLNVLRKAKLLLSLLCLKNWQFSKISPITLAITNLFSKAKKNVTQLKSLRKIPLLNKKITNCLKRFGFIGI
ncbi:hypothetical protein GGTG_10988 [Gaeumannomyces tritici R3-111a-1]|uniref:Uncharacterized protein n=1 Tax=Gaeumannomyces tritici (strain R3-111a-1) TaxID=644352 RepID=J3PBW4_GAET3|nr:hypothetical protein GGTG_10988 [Gaeumannomyces tritici R3-111a-1]EJT71734.1 hypothetical protein GGTG_10988 [Gaeumannomyces tritici R3-111a-1]